MHKSAQWCSTFQNWKKDDLLSISDRLGFFFTPNSRLLFGNVDGPGFPTQCMLTARNINILMDAKSHTHAHALPTRSMTLERGCFFYLTQQIFIKMRWFDIWFRVNRSMARMQDDKCRMAERCIGGGDGCVRSPVFNVDIIVLGATRRFHSP